ncbi:hypothetical protein KM043_006606 [Ampulex compressa]|nr:hypothetical protein KM043_006606 [Ampulex compressa]
MAGKQDCADASGNCTRIEEWTLALVRAPGMESTWIGDKPMIKVDFQGDASVDVRGRSESELKSVKETCLTGCASGKESRLAKRARSSGKKSQICRIACRKSVSAAQT